MHIDSDIVGRIMEESLQESREYIHYNQKTLAVFSGTMVEQEEFWKRPGGMRLAGVIFRPDQKTIHVLFLSGNYYLLPIATLKNVCAEDVFDVNLDEFDDAVVVKTIAGETTDFSSDFVLYHCEPRYRRQVDSSYQPKTESIAKRVGRRVREMRKKKGMSLRSFAKAAELAVANASNLEAGKHEPKLETLHRASKVLGVSIADLVSV